MESRYRRRGRRRLLPGQPQQPRETGVARLTPVRVRYDPRPHDGRGRWLALVLSAALGLASDPFPRCAESELPQSRAWRALAPQAIPPWLVRARDAVEQSVRPKCATVDADPVRGGKYLRQDLCLRLSADRFENTHVFFAPGSETRHGSMPVATEAVAVPGKMAEEVAVRGKMAAAVAFASVILPVTDSSHAPGIDGSAIQDQTDVDRSGWARLDTLALCVSQRGTSGSDLHRANCREPYVPLASRRPADVSVADVPRRPAGGIVVSPSGIRRDGLAGS